LPSVLKQVSGCCTFISVVGEAKSIIFINLSLCEREMGYVYLGTSLMLYGFYRKSQSIC